MNYAAINDIVGLYQINFIYDVDTTQRHRTGLTVAAIDTYWGYGEFIYGKAAGTVGMGDTATMASVLVSGALELQMTVATRVASAARPYCVACADMTVGQFGWFCISGVVPMKAVAGVLAAGASVALSATPGSIGAAAATFGIQGATVSLPATTTVAKTGCKGIAGQFTVDIPNGEGWFKGCVITGTGMGASALIDQISPDGRTATVTVANAAAVSGTLTATYTGFALAFISRPAGLGL